MGPSPNKRLSRRAFLKLVAGAFLFLSSGFPFKSAVAAQTRPGAPHLKPRPKKGLSLPYDLAIAKFEDPAEATRVALETLGGMGAFVKKGDIVVIKPNIGWDRSPAQAANTNPTVVATLVQMALEAGARRVKVFDRTCNDAKRTYVTSGIAEAVRASGGEIQYVEDWRFQAAEFPEGSHLKGMYLYRDAIECDTFINCPVAKHHTLTRATLSMKNLMGICGGDRGKIHFNIKYKLAGLAQFVNPDLTVLDATRILVRNGPSGGDLADVRLHNEVIAGRDPVLIDSYGATLFGLEPEEIGYIAVAGQMGLGSLNLSGARLKKIG